MLTFKLQHFFEWISSIFGKCWNLCYSISQNMLEIHTKKMLLLKSWHLTWGGPIRNFKIRIVQGYYKTWKTPCTSSKDHIVHGTGGPRILWKMGQREILNPHYTSTLHYRDLYSVVLADLLYKTKLHYSEYHTMQGLAVVVLKVLLY